VSTRLAPLTPELRAAVARLEVTDAQRGYLTTTSFARFLDGAPQHPTFEVRAILDGDRCVGFVSFGHEPGEAGRWWIPLLVVDRAAQRRGHGRAALEQVVAEARDGGATAIGLSYHPSNTVAGRLYAALGFEARPGLTPTGEVEAWLVLDPGR